LFKCWACFIRGYPATISKLESSFLKNIIEFMLCLLILSIPPRFEEHDIRMSKFLVFINPKFFNQTVQNMIDVNLVSCDSFSPTCVLMRVWDNMHLDFLIWGDINAIMEVLFLPITTYCNRKQRYYEKYLKKTGHIFYLKHRRH